MTAFIDDFVGSIRGRRAVLTVAAWLLLGMVGCSATRTVPTATTPDASPRDRLAAAAAIERAGASDASAGIWRDSVPAPPDADGSALTPRAPDDPKAHRSLADAVSHAAALMPLRSRTPAAAPGTIDDRIEAERHYVRARDAMLERRMLIAAQELEQARALDPSSTSIVRQLARAYGAAGNAPRAVAAYQRLLELEPSDSEATFAIGWDAGSQRRFDEAIAMLGASEAAAAAFPHDPAAEVVASHMLAVCLRFAGYDRASIEAHHTVLDAIDSFGGVPTSYAAQIDSIRRQRGDLWRDTGDAHVRLGEHSEACDAYRRALEETVVDAWSVHIRLIYAMLKDGRRAAAHLAFVQAIEESVDGLDERAVRAASYLAEVGGDMEPLGLAMEQVLAAHPESPYLARAAAAVLPLERGSAALREMIRRRPDDFRAVRQLFAWLATRDSASAFALATGLVADHPEHAFDYAAALGPFVDPSSPPPSGGGEPDEAAWFLRSRLAAQAGVLGLAWSMNEAGLAAAPRSRLLRLHRVVLAGALGEVELLEESIASTGDLDDAEAWVTRARALLSANRVRDSETAAAEAVARDDASAAAWTHIALVRLASGAPAQEVEQAARRAIALAPVRDEPYEILLRLHGTTGPAEDADRALAVVRELAANHPGSGLLVIIEADQAVARRRFDHAAALLTARYESDLAFEPALARLVDVRVQQQNLDAARLYVESHRRDRPHDPNVRRQWVRVLIQQGKRDEVVRILRDQLNADPDDLVALQLLEVALRAGSEWHEANQLAERRLLTRPDAAGRAIDLAALFAADQRLLRAVEELRPLHARFSRLPDEFADRLLRAVVAMDGESPALEPFRWSVIDAFLARYADAPVSVHAAGLVSLTRLGHESAFDALLSRALTAIERAAGDADARLVAVRDVAQSLVDAEAPRSAAHAIERAAASWGVREPREALFVGQLLQAAHLAAGDVGAARSVIDGLARDGMLAHSPLVEDGADLRAASLYALSLLATLTGREAAAAELLERVLAIEPNHAMALNNLGYQRLVRAESIERTTDMIERAHAFMPDDANVLDTIGWLRYRQGRFDADPVAKTPGARQLLEEALRAASATGEGPSPELHDHLGDARWRRGDREGAIAAWTRALQLVESREFRDATINGYARFQQLGWGLRIADPAAIYDENHRHILIVTRAKIEQARRGQTPALALTFAEDADGR
jgi:tetratricopeptide (TPR) repeat protein